LKDFNRATSEFRKESTPFSGCGICAWHFVGCFVGQTIEGESIGFGHREVSVLDQGVLLRFAFVAVVMALEVEIDKNELRAANGEFGEAIQRPVEIRKGLELSADEMRAEVE
jgi:hypothetical protein